MTDTKKLRALAEAATEGPWKVRKEGSSCGYLDWQIYEAGTGGHHAQTSEMLNDEKARPDAEYIAAMHPQQTLELLDEIEELERQIKGEQDGHDFQVKCYNEAYRELERVSEELYQLRKSLRDPRPADPRDEIADAGMDYRKDEGQDD